MPIRWPIEAIPKTVIYSALGIFAIYLYTTNRAGFSSYLPLLILFTLLILPYFNFAFPVQVWPLEVLSMQVGATTLFIILVALAKAGGEVFLADWPTPTWVFALLIGVIFTVAIPWLMLETLLVEIVDYLRYGPRNSQKRIIRAQEILDTASADNVWVDLNPSPRRRMISHLYDLGIWKQEYYLRKLQNAYDVAAGNAALSEPTVEELQALVDDLNANAGDRNAREGRSLQDDIRPFLDHPLVHKAATLLNGIVVRPWHSTSTRLHILGPWDHIDAESRAIRCNSTTQRWELPDKWNTPENNPNHWQHQ